MKTAPHIDSLNDKNLESAAESLKVLGHPDRLRIIGFLNKEGEAPVHSIEDFLGLSQPHTSTHLSCLRRVGLLSAERRGKEVWYSLADERSLDVLRCMAQKN